jgi:hypothetical protein
VHSVLPLVLSWQPPFAAPACTLDATSNREMCKVRRSIFNKDIIESTEKRNIVLRIDAKLADDVAYLRDLKK